MNNTKYFIILSVMSIFTVMYTGCGKVIDGSSNLTEWRVLFSDEDWNNFPGEELEMFSGTLSYDPHNSYPPYVQRYNPYKLEQYDVYCGSSDVLKAYIGKKVVIEGKLETMSVEGHVFREIWPTKIKVEP
jgi:hypothetical protein